MHRFSPPSVTEGWQGPYSSRMGSWSEWVYTMYERGRGSPCMVIVSIQVPVEQFPGCVCKLVGKLYDAVEAVVKGRLKGPGALGTLVLCESLMSFIPTGSTKDQPHRLWCGYLRNSTIQQTDRPMLICITLQWNPVHQPSVGWEHLGPLNITVVISPFHGQADHGVLQGSPGIKVGIRKGSTYYRRAVQA